MSQIATPREKVVFFSNQNAAATSAAMRVFGGYYAWSIQGTLGTSAQLQYLGDDGVTWQNFGATRTTNDVGNTPANSATMIVVGGTGVQMRCIIVGSPTALYISLNRVP